MFYNDNLIIELLNFYSFGSKFLKDYLNKFLSPFESKVFWLSKVLFCQRKIQEGILLFKLFSR